MQMLVGSSETCTSMLDIFPIESVDTEELELLLNDGMPRLEGVVSRDADAIVTKDDVLRYDDMLLALSHAIDEGDIEKAQGLHAEGLDWLLRTCNHSPKIIDDLRHASDYWNSERLRDLQARYGSMRALTKREDEHDGCRSSGFKEQYASDGYFTQNLATSTVCASGGVIEQNASAEISCDKSNAHNLATSMASPDAWETFKEIAGEHDRTITL